MRRMYLPPQLARLLILTLAIVGSYVTARQILTPESFGEYGWFRAKALQELADRPLSYGGKQACLECHEEIVAGMTKSKSKHSNVPCETCHGPAYPHTQDPLANTPAKITHLRFCLRCHQANPARPEKFPQVEAQEHFGDQQCTECHQPHSPTDSPPK